MSFQGMHRSAPVLVILAMALLASGAVAGDRECPKEPKPPRTIAIELDDDDLILTRNCGDDSKVVMVNLEAVEDLVAVALDDVSTVLDELGELQMEIRLGQDNRLSFADADTEWEVDLGQIAMQLESALRAGFAEVEAEDWGSRHSRHARNDEVEALQEELDSLRREMKQLKKQLEKNTSGDD